jgi:copper resistance protein D
MGSLYLFSVWLHILAAAAWVGTLVFLAAVLVPVLRRQGDEALRACVLRASGPGLRTLGWTSFGILVVTGTVNLAGRGFVLEDVGWRLWQGPFGRAFTWKLALFGVVLLLSALHDFRWGPRAAAAVPGSPEALRLRRIASWVGRANLLLALAIVAFAVMLVRGWP